MSTQLTRGRCLHDMPSKIVIACNVLAFMFALSVPCWKVYETSWAFREAEDPSKYDDLKASQHGQKETLVVPALGSCASSGRAPGGAAARHSHQGARASLL